jgi:2-C-methyl-D-erythritol 2,4-cyclodiphosphate synthase
MIRIGQGFDVHVLVEGRPLILGGVELEFNKGLLGHSDADALLHAITDAILGAAGLGDIGHFFPDDDPKYKGADSLVLLADAFAAVKARGFALGNVDATILAERPKMKPHLPAMIENIARTLEVDVAQVNLKATTMEKMGFVGREEGIGAMAVALLVPAN